MSRDTENDIEIIARFNGGNGGVSLHLKEVDLDTDAETDLGGVFLNPGRAVETAITLVEKAVGQVPDDIKARLRALVGPGRIVIPVALKEGP